jgi:hypothetical protein
MPKAKLDYYRYADTNERILIAYCSKNTFLKLAKANTKENASVNWIKERISRTTNISELELMKVNEGMMIVVEKGFPREFVPLQPMHEICKSCSSKQSIESTCRYSYNQHNGRKD